MKLISKQITSDATANEIVKEWSKSTAGSLRSKYCTPRGSKHEL